MPGAPWNNHEWGFEVLTALVRLALGWGGLRLLVLAIAVPTAVGLAIVIGRRAGAAWALLAVTLFGLFARYKMMPVPQLASMALFLAAFHFFRGERLACSGRRAAVLACAMLVWGNLSAESLMFLPFLVLDQLLVRWAPRTGTALPSLGRHLFRVGIPCLTPLLTPPWSSTLAYVLGGTLANREVNAEFAPLWAPATAVTPLAKHVAMGIVAIYAIWVAAALWRTKDRRAAVRRAAPGVMAAVLAVAFERNLWLLLIPVARMTMEARAWATTGRRQLAAAACAGSVAVGIFTGFATVLRWTPQEAIAQLASPRYYRDHLNRLQLPIDCIDPLAGDARVRRVFTLRMWSNYVVWRLPQAKIFVDGRNREFPVELHRAGKQIWAGGPAALALLDASGTDTVIAPPHWGASPYVAGGPWRVTATGPGCAVFRRAR
jgi:hypothetical protein